MHCGKSDVARMVCRRRHVSRWAARPCPQNHHIDRSGRTPRRGGPPWPPSKRKPGCPPFKSAAGQAPFRHVLELPACRHCSNRKFFNGIRRRSREPVFSSWFPTYASHNESCLVLPCQSEGCRLKAEGDHKGYAVVEKSRSIPAAYSLRFLVFSLVRRGCAGRGRAAICQISNQKTQISKKSQI